MNTCKSLITLLLAATTAMAQPEPDMDDSGCVDLFDVALFQEQFGTIEIPGIARCDFQADGHCDLLDHTSLVSVLRGPICECAVDAECADSYPCTMDDCYAGTCRHASNDSVCGGLDDTDADCERGYCDVTGCVTVPEPVGSPCDDGVDCTTASECTRDLENQPHCGATAYDDSRCGNQNDGDADCTQELCGGLGCFEYPEPVGSPCDDGVDCTTASECIRDLENQPYCGATAYDDSRCGNQNDSDADCMEGLCGGAGCFEIPEPVGAPCDEGNAEDGDGDCTKNACMSGACGLLNEPDGSPCEDGIACTASDYCAGGQCAAGIYIDAACPNQDHCDDDCIQYYCEPGQGCVQGVEFEFAPCRSLFCDLNGLYSACNVTGGCECRSQPAPDFGCPP